MKGIAVVLMLATALWSQTGSGLSALQIGSSGRATAMAEAATAVARAADAPFWNPAGLALLTRQQVHLTHNEWIQGINHEALSYARPAGTWTWGIHAMLTSVDDIELRTIASEEPLSTFSSHTVVAGVTLARRIGERISFGVNLHYLHEKIYIESAEGFAADLGVRFRTPFRGLDLGAAVQNLGSTSALYQEKINLPETMRLGVAYTVPLGEGPIHALLAADYVNVFDKDGYFNIGLEIWPQSQLAMRAGYAANHSNRDFSMGFGINLKSALLDYAYVPFKQGLGNTHQISITLDL